MKVLVIITFAIFCTNYLRGDFHQDDYHIDHEKIIITGYNRSATRNPYIKLIKHEGQRMLAITASAYFTPGVKKNIIINAALFKLAKKKYRPFPINITFDGCQESGSNSNLFGAQSAILASNFRGCPCLPGEYYIKDYSLEEDKFPPHLPTGQYKLKVYIKIDDTIFLLSGEWYGSLNAKNSKLENKK